MFAHVTTPDKTKPFQTKQIPDTQLNHNDEKGVVVDVGNSGNGHHQEQITTPTRASRQSMKTRIIEKSIPVQHPKAETSEIVVIVVT